jgi:hypothetical protein
MLLVFQVRSAQEISFTQPQLDSAGNLILSLHGDPNTNYVIENSPDLRTWKPIFVGATSSDGQLGYTLYRKADASAAYYTARSRTDLEKLIVIPQPDTNYATVALVTTNGGACSLTNKDGVIYTFTAPPFAVLESVVISMILLTNIDHFPLTNGFGAAVSFEPDGLQFFNPGLLEIRYPTNFQPLDVVSYAFGSDGKDIYLTPDLVTSNAITIPVIHFSSVGSTFAAREAEAVFKGKAIQNALDRASQGVTQEILEARERNDPNGAAEALGRVEQIAQDFYDQSIKPLEGRMTNNCALFHELTAAVFSLGKQVQLTAGEPKFVEKYFDSDFCVAFDNCFKEALDRCSLNALRGRDKFFDMARYVSVTVPVCDVPDHEEFVRKCLPAWHGTITYSEAGTTNEITTFGGGGRGSLTTSIGFAGEAQVAVAEVVPGGLQLKLEGWADAFEIVEGYTTQPLPCGKLHTQDSRSVAAGAGVQKLNLSAIFAGTNLIFLTVFPDGDLKLDKGYASYVDELPSCLEDGQSRIYRGGAPHTSRRTPSAVTLLGAPPFGTPPFGNTDEIVGTYTVDTVSSGIPVKAIWNFNLKRKK